MNPTEFFNNDFRQEICSETYTTAEDTVDTARDYIIWYEDYEIAAKELVKSFFRAPSCKYTLTIYNKVFCKDSKQAAN